MMANQLKRLIYKAFSPRYLLVTNTVTGVISLVGADWIQQGVTHHYIKTKSDKEKDDCKEYVHDYQRSLGMAAGGLFFGVAGHYWYTFLDRKFPGKIVSNIASKLACEMAAGPPFVVSCFYIVNLVEGKPYHEWYQNLKRIFTYILITEWGCFLPLQAINFYFLPPKYRYLFVAVLTLLYDNFLSFIFHR